ncbi:anti-sigma factor [Streptomyces sp. AD55]|uniref:anti-sigma factor n=1 Tax=Streptomyces sp. AD55 TaxID=3242895 RepID=UPI00352956B7
MTSSTADMTGHPEVTEISDLTEGLLAAPRATLLRRHLERCAACADVHASLLEIRDLLDTLPEPVPMPEEVASRIDAALAAEATTREPSPDSGSVSRETRATAARPAGHARPSTTGPGRKSRGRAGRRRIAILGAVTAAAALGLGSVIVSSLGRDSTPDTAARAQATLADTFSEGQLKDRVAALLAGGQLDESGPGTPHTLGMESETGPESRVLEQPTVPECVRQGIGRDDVALATETGVYQGKEALLVVLPDSTHAGRVTAYLVDSTCVGRPSLGEGTVLLQHSYARP